MKPLRTDFAHAGKHLVGVRQRANLAALHDWLVNDVRIPESERVLAATNYQQGHFGRLPNHVIVVTASRLAFTHDSGTRMIPFDELDLSRVGLRAGMVNGELTLILKSGEQLRFRKSVSLGIQEVAAVLESQARPSGPATSSTTDRHNSTASNDDDEAQFAVGAGQDVLEFTQPCSGFLEFESHGGDHTSVWGLDSNLAQSELLVNTVGEYRGVKVLGIDEKVAALQIDTTNSWRCRFLPPSVLPELKQGEEIAGVGDTVMLTAPWDSGGSETAQILFFAHNGSANFIMRTWFDGQPLVNEIGPVEGRVIVPATTCFLSIEADGPWSLKI